MKNRNITLLLLAILICTNSYCSDTSLKAKIGQLALQVSASTLPDSVLVDTITFEDMNYEYRILQYKVNGEIVQMDIDQEGSSVAIDYIIWDMDKNGRMEAIGVYDLLNQKYDYYLIEEDLAADDLLGFQVQLEDIGFPSFYNSSSIPKAVYKSEEHQPVLNYYKTGDH